MKSDVINAIAVIACLITFFVSRKILQEGLKIGPPNILAACVAILAFIGLRQTGQDFTLFIPFSYEVLAIALLLLFLLFLFGRITGTLANKIKKRNKNTPSQWFKEGSCHNGFRQEKQSPPPIKQNQQLPYDRTNQQK